MAWILNQQYFRDNLKFGPGGETGAVNDLVRSITERIGANIMGKRMFEQGERSWPEEAPFHTPVFVLTHDEREPWERPGGTTFYFITEGPQQALDLARQAAGSRDVRISGGADVIQQYLNMGVVEELEIALAPVLFGSGRRLFENLSDPGPQFSIDQSPRRSNMPRTCAICGRLPTIRPLRACRSLSAAPPGCAAEFLVGVEGIT